MLDKTSDTTQTGSRCLPLTKPFQEPAGQRGSRQWPGGFSSPGQVTQGDMSVQSEPRTARQDLTPWAEQGAGQERL